MRSTRSSTRAARRSPESNSRTPTPPESVRAGILPERAFRTADAVASGGLTPKRGRHSRLRFSTPAAPPAPSPSQGEDWGEVESPASGIFIRNVERRTHAGLRRGQSVATLINHSSFVGERWSFTPGTTCAGFSKLRLSSALDQQGADKQERQACRLREVVRVRNRQTQLKHITGLGGCDSAVNAVMHLGGLCRVGDVSPRTGG
jgi:hypothetical protein